MASSAICLRTCSLLRQLQSQCRLSKQLLLTCRYASTANAPSPQSPTSASSPKKAHPPPSQRPQNDVPFSPQPLDRPLGVARPPKPGQNSGIDTRTLRQRRNDFVDYDKHLERRRTMTRQMARPYYRDWTNMKVAEGKLWIAPTKLFRADKALYMPNLQGSTLSQPREARDTVDVMRGKVSVVGAYSGDWAMRQVETFTRGDEKLEEMLEDGRHGRSPLQRVELNVEQNPMKAWLIRLFLGGLKRKTPQHEHERYFMVRRGLTDELKEHIGMFNSAIGYVYLVDQDCRIRWAASANAHPEEKASLVRGAAKLVREYQPPVSEEGEKHTALSASMSAASAY